MLRLRLIFTLAILSLFSTIIPMARAQDSVTITVAVPTFLSNDIFDEDSDLMQSFKAAYPGINVQIVKSSINIPVPANGIDSHLTETENYVKSADVLFIDSRQTRISPEAVRAGYFLNLAPLTEVDQALNTNDFYPAAWNSFRWDYGMWALPTALDFVVVSYDETAFTQAGLALPNSSWTLADFALAAELLTTKDEVGNIIQAGLGVTNDAYPAFFRSLLSTSVVDTSQVPEVPVLNTPEVATLLNQWVELENAGYVGGGNAAPISVSFLSNGLRGPRNNNPRGLVLLPGDVSAVLPQGFAISAGTKYPEQAYTFISYLTTRTELTSRFSIASSRASIGVASGGGGFGQNFSPEQQDLITQATTNGLPLTEMHFADRLLTALEKMKTDGVDAQTALQEIDALAFQDLAAADAKKNTVVIEVATPIPAVVLSEGEVALRFGIESFTNPLAKQEAWDALIADFVANDQQVAAIKFDTIIRVGNITSLTTDFDCFYLNDNAVQSADLSLLMSIDPFLAADPSFSKDDVVTGVLNQVTRDNKVWAFPMVIEPSILRYDSTTFDQSGVPAPLMTWTVDNFTQTLQALRLQPGDPAPFAASNSNGAHLLLLVAAYGGLPFDYGTTPVTIDFTNPQTVDAIRQVLDLARQGYIKYDSLAQIAFGRGARDIDVPIYADALNVISGRGARIFGGGGQNEQQQQNEEDKPIVYPVGTDLYGATYSIGAGYISSAAKSVEAEACYRWLSTISLHPELFSSMPARKSMISDPSLEAAQGPDMAALYARTAELLDNPRTIILPSLTAGGGGGINGFILQRWLFEAFDTYVLNDGDLDEALKTAEVYAKGYVECTNALPPFDPSTQSFRDYNLQFAQCAIQVDPRLEGMVGGR